jgi:predicted transposase/invertase (TIGR01784 family)
MAMPHDKLAKAVFSQLEHARAELCSVLPTSIVEKADWSTLVLVSGEFVDPSLAHLHTDLLYTVNIGSKTACIYVLLEHMSTVERTMPLRLLQYMTKIWSRFERDNPGKPLPLIIPVVLHHSSTGWTAPTQFGDLFDVGELRSVASQFVPDFSFVLDDLTMVDDEALRARAVTELVRLTLLVLQRCRDSEDPVTILRPWMSTMVAVLTAPKGVEALSAVVGYIMEASEGRPEELGAFFRELGPKAEEAYVTAAEKLTAQARAKALEQGRAEGEAKGRTEGQAAVLLKQLGLRFGPLSEQVRARVQSAGPDELDCWAEKVLSASTLEDLFGA